MPNQVLSSVENNFTKGLITESTGLNFPENAATDCDNCLFTLIGDVLRREGIDLEENHANTRVLRQNKAMNTFKWVNAGGEGLTQIEVVQVGNILYFYSITSATESSPLSTQQLASTIDISAYLSGGNIHDPSDTECQFTTGNGYLFAFHPDLDPFYCTYVNGSITASRITVQIRDFVGIPEPGVADSVRLNTLSNEHEYNLTNQGWTAGGPWQAQAGQNEVVATGLHYFGVGAGIPATIGQHVSIYTRDGPQTGSVTMSGTLTAYAGNIMTIFVDSVDNALQNNSYFSWYLVPSSNSYIGTWQTQVGNYPSNADVWWRYKDSNNVFSPATMLNSVTLGTPAPKGHYIMPAFVQDRSLVSAIEGLTSISTHIRPRTGTWFQGRVWYAGVDSSQAATGDAPHYSWTENLYFSQIVQTVDDFGKCYQLNDPTNEDLFDLLPTDGGVVTIPGCGSVYKLFPIQNGLLVFAANGIWFITGSQGIGFTANDYTVTKISSVECISGSSFVDVLGLPYFWNEEGIYKVAVSQTGSLQVDSITVGTILSFYNDIPKSSKLYVKAAYDPIEYVIQWIYRSSEETDVSSRYEYDRILNFNTYNKAFYPYSVDNTTTSINGIAFIQGPGGSTSPPSKMKYLCSYFNTTGDGFDSTMTFADEHDTTYVDWASSNPANFESYFITGYKLHGQAQRRFQIPYIYTFVKNDNPSSFYIQSIWDYATDSNSNRWSTRQQINTFNPHFGVVFRRTRLRGQGLVLQLKYSSVDGQPFDILGWSVFETTNTGV